ncbi:MAG: nucleotide exchange factor GrpE [Ruminococcaceae bacterium]|nr:nucleotide exchange factor GrpE [Oscillospiraceae bacterium]
MIDENVKQGDAVETAETAETVDENAPAEEKAEKTDKKKNKKLESKISELEAKLEEADKAAAEQNDKYMRLAAEYDNFRKRSAKEKEGIYSDAYADALKSILPIIDNLERAVGVEGADAVAKGLEMTLKGATEALEKMGVEAFGAEGDEFDPNMHNAMMMVDDENHKEGEIVTVFQKGYKKGDKIIRYAMVTVAN